jgi:hypothetical protein
MRCYVLHSLISGGSHGPLMTRCQLTLYVKTNVKYNSVSKLLTSDLEVIFIKINRE